MRKIAKLGFQVIEDVKTMTTDHPARLSGGFGRIGGTGTGRPDFAAAVPPGGYAWWYVDALSDDRRDGLTIIAFIGSVFSPWYAWARRRGPAPAENHCAINVALYGAGGKRWAMTERGPDALKRDATSLAIGPSALHWDGHTLTLDIDEVTAPLPSRVRGVVRLTPTGLGQTTVSLDAAGRHGWSPIAPTSRVSVSMSHPTRAWEGHGYFDTNWGARPLEADFAEWHWCRATLHDGAAVLYDITRRTGEHFGVARRYWADGTSAPFDPPPEVALKPGFWCLPRVTRTDLGTTARVVQTVEDSPFYARSVVEMHLLGRKVEAMHETLSLRRFDTPWMRLMLPFKAPKERKFFGSYFQKRTTSS
jgi:carotenoid 1,2-hydratase